MPRGSNPNSRKNLVDISTRTTKEQRKIQKKGGIVSGEKRRNWATFRDCFKDKMTDEDMEKAYAKLWELFLKDGKLDALAMLRDIFEDSSAVQNNITIKFGSQEMDEYGD